MTIKNDKYPTKEDYNPNRGRKGSGELPLADPSESSVTNVPKFERKREEVESKPSAFDDNKRNRDN